MYAGDRDALPLFGLVDRSTVADDDFLLTSPDDPMLDNKLPTPRSEQGRDSDSAGPLTPRGGGGPAVVDMDGSVASMGFYDMDDASSDADDWCVCRVSSCLVSCFASVPSANADESAVSDGVEGQGAEEASWGQERVVTSVLEAVSRASGFPLRAGVGGGGRSLGTVKADWCWRDSYVVDAMFGRRLMGSSSLTPRKVSPRERPRPTSPPGSSLAEMEAILSVSPSHSHSRIVRAAAPSTRLPRREPPHPVPPPFCVPSQKCASLRTHDSACTHAWGRPYAPSHQPPPTCDSYVCVCACVRCSVVWKHVSRRRRQVTKALAPALRSQATAVTRAFER